jgi:hypothetical protein
LASRLTGNVRLTTPECNRPFRFFDRELRNVGGPTLRQKPERGACCDRNRRPDLIAGLADGFGEIGPLRDVAVQRSNRDDVQLNLL